MKKHFTKKDTQMVNKHMERCVSLATERTQIKTTMSYHHTPIRMEKIKLLIPANAVEEAGRRKTRSLTHSRWERKRAWQLLKKPTTQLLHVPEIALLGIYPREKKSLCSHKTLHANSSFGCIISKLEPIQMYVPQCKNGETHHGI